MDHRWTQDYTLTPENFQDHRRTLDHQSIPLSGSFDHRYTISLLLSRRLWSNSKQGQLMAVFSNLLKLPAFSVFVIDALRAHLIYGLRKLIFSPKKVFVMEGL